MPQLQGRRVVVLQDRSDALCTRYLYYLCHSTEQASLRKVLLCYEYRDEIADTEFKREFLQAIKARAYQVAMELFDKHCATYEIYVEQFAGDEAGVNHGEELAAIQLDVDGQLEAIRWVEQADIAADLELDDEHPSELENNDCEKQGGPPI